MIFWRTKCRHCGYELVEINAKKLNRSQISWKNSGSAGWKRELKEG
jgi:hypothetical protein